VRQERPKKDGFDKYTIIERPVATEKAMKKMEEENTMVIILFRSSCVPLVQIRIKLKKPSSVFTIPKLEV
jgi:ribosomal protein L23